MAQTRSSTKAISRTPTSEWMLLPLCDNGCCLPACLHLPLLRLPLLLSLVLLTATLSVVSECSCHKLHCHKLVPLLLQDHAVHFLPPPRDGPAGGAAQPRGAGAQHVALPPDEFRI